MCLFSSRIIYTRFHTKSAVLLRRIIKSKYWSRNKTLIVEIFGPLQGNHELFTEDATKKSAPFWSFFELHLPAGLLEVAGRLHFFYYRGLNPLVFVGDGKIIGAKVLTMFFTNYCGLRFQQYKLNKMAKNERLSFKENSNKFEWIKVLAQTCSMNNLNDRQKSMC